MSVNLVLKDLGQEYCLWDALLQIAQEYPIKSYLEIGSRYGDSLMRVLMGAESRMSRKVIHEVPALDRIVIADIWHESYFGGGPGSGTGFDRSHKHIVRFMNSLGYTGEQVIFLDGDSAQTVPLLDKRVPFDLVTVDGDHEVTAAAKDLFNAWQLVAPGGFLVFDDVNDQELSQLFTAFTKSVSEIGASFIRQNKKEGVAVAWKQSHNLETSKIRDQVISYFKGEGIDVGCSRDPLTRSCVAYDQSDWPEVTVRGPADKLPFPNEHFDWLWSSHTLEDFEDTDAVITEWLRVLKPGGTIGLYVPNPDYYLPNNTDHKKAGFRELELELLLKHHGCETVLIRLDVESTPGVDRYSTLAIARKL